MIKGNQGFASMDEAKQRQIASKGGKSSSGNFANDRQRASEAGKKGAAAQPTEAKRRGGENSHRNSQ
jgi:general stress protein YciG